MTHIDRKEGDTLVPGGTSGGSATRASPFAALELHPGAGQTFAAGASAGITARAQESVKLTDLRGDLSYTYLGASGTTQAPVFRIEASASASKVDYFDPNSPYSYAFRARTQIHSFYAGAQFNFGADQLTPERAAALLDARTETAEEITPGGTSGLFVIGFLH